jgi:type VI secretion system protein ImpA
MSSAPAFDIDRLLAPIPGDDPAGRPVSFVQRQKLDAARKSVNPADYAADDPLRPAEPKPADWPLILDVTQAILTDEGKDLMTAARLTEAATKQYGFAGLRDGLTLLRRLVSECWDRLTPPIEDGDLDVRAAPFNWLDDPDRGARFPNAVRAIPLLGRDDDPISWLDWKTAQTAAPPKQEDYGEPKPDPRVAFAEKFDKAVLAASRADCQAQVEDLAAAAGEITAAADALEKHMGDDAPGLGELRKAVSDCHELARQILEKKGPAPSEAPPAAEPEPAAADAPAGAAAAPAANGTHRPAPRMLTRDDAYQQLASAAALLQQLEPHSPIPFMVQRAVALGRLPFPELMKVMIRDQSVLDQLTRELGLAAPDAG